MNLSAEEAFKRAYDYAKRRNRNILRQDSAGHGMEGWVWKTDVPSAIKVFYRHSDFQTELSCYQRLKEHGVNEIHGHNVPVLEDFDSGLRVLEITFVQPPYLLDFGKATLDEPPDYFRDRADIRRFESEWQAGFGERWPEVAALLHTLRVKHGIYYLDPREPNIKFDSDDSDDGWLDEPPIDYSAYD